MKLKADKLQTNELQFGFKTGSSTSLCASMVQETVSYFVHRGSTVDALMLDASKAFDRVNYYKLFRKLLDRKVCPLFCRLLLNMHLNQRLQVRWENNYSDGFSVTNGVKQGGVISPVLFCVYMDNFLQELAASGVGCYMGSVYAGAFGYADDLILLSPSVSALHEMSAMCEGYANRHSVKFNGKKSKVINFKSNSAPILDPCVTINDTKVDVVDSIIYLGYRMTDNI